MATELRDLDADRRLCEAELCLPPAGDDQVTLIDFGNQARVGWLSALDEIERLKWLVVWEQDGKWVARITPHNYRMGFETKADAWAAVRKAAINGD